MTKRKIAAGGWMVKAVTPDLAGGDPIEQWFTVGEPDRVEAELAVKKHPDAGEAAVIARRQLSDDEIATLALKPGEVRSYH